jgi:hypothetical protein
VGRPRLRWLEDVRNDLGEVKEKSLIQKANNRGKLTLFSQEQRFSTSCRWRHVADIILIFLFACYLHWSGELRFMLKVYIFFLNNIIYLVKILNYCKRGARGSVVA